MKTSAKRRVIVAQKLKNALSNFAPMFNGSRMHDSHELIAILLNGIHEDLNRVTETENVTYQNIVENDEVYASEEWKFHLQRNNSVIVHSFQGQLRTKCQCHICGNIVVRFEPFMYLCLPIDDKSTSLDDCVAKYVAEDKLVGANQWYCSKCEKYVDATTQTEIWALPPILIVCLKRFRLDEFTGEVLKIETALKYPVVGWDLSKVVQSKSGGDTSYDLYAVSNHVGCADNGHYTTCAQNRFDKQWYEFNDNTFRVIDPISTFELSPSPYVLFYRRSESGTRGIGIHQRSLGLHKPDPDSLTQHLVHSSIKANDDDGIPSPIENTFSPSTRRESHGLSNTTIMAPPSRRLSPTHLDVVKDLVDESNSDAS
jgi:ubiquitin carboxyl-terminal hydrolase 8